MCSVQKDIDVDSYCLGVVYPNLQFLGLLWIHLMGLGFFEASLVTRKPPVVSILPKCGACGIFKTCKSPKLPVSGGGRKGILVVGDVPGIDSELSEDFQYKGKHFSGDAGQFLKATFREFDIDFDRDCWHTNALICDLPDERSVTNEQIEHCRPNLTKVIEDLNPRVIVPLGIAAVRSLIIPYWKEDVGPIGDWVGWKIPLQRLNTWITPMHHPSFILKMKDKREGPVVKLWFQRHVEGMSNLEGRPWAEVPDYQKEIQVIMNPEEAASWITDRNLTGGVFALDYETDRLKPDAPDSRIVSSSVCWNGKETIAYPWVGSAIPATKSLIMSGHRFVGANTKFEDRWSKRHLGCFVNSWIHDTMLSSHHLDNRGGISSVKFQSFVRLGLEPYNIAVEPFFKADDANSKNRIDEIDLMTLLTYNGVDSLVEYQIAVRQRNELKSEPFGV